MRSTAQELGTVELLQRVLADIQKHADLRQFVLRLVPQAHEQLMRADEDLRAARAINPFYVLASTLNVVGKLPEVHHDVGASWLAIAETIVPLLPPTARSRLEPFVKSAQLSLGPRPPAPGGLEPPPAGPPSGGEADDRHAQGANVTPFDGQELLSDLAEGGETSLPNQPKGPSRLDDIVGVWVGQHELGAPSRVTDFVLHAHRSLARHRWPVPEDVFHEDADALKAIFSSTSLSAEPWAVSELQRQVRAVLFRPVNLEVMAPDARLNWLTNWYLDWWLLQIWKNHQQPERLSACGYVVNNFIANRYDDEQTEVLDKSCRLVMQTVAEFPLSLIDPEVEFVRGWLANATGTYLLYFGPEPVLPSRVRVERTTPRLSSGRLMARGEWARELLGRWSGTEHRTGAALALARLCGWREDRLQALLDDGRDALRLSRAESELWLEAGGEALENRHRIHFGGSANSFDARDVEEARAAVASTFQQAGVHGSIQLVSQDDAAFNGTTFLATGHRGPLGVVKIVSLEDALRERVGFDSYGSSLPTGFRPNQVVVSNVTMGHHQARRECVVYSEYAFLSREQLVPFQEWCTKAEPEVLCGFLEGLFANALRDWYGRLQRNVRDFRLQYSIYRPFIPRSYAGVGGDREAELERLRQALPESLFSWPAGELVRVTDADGVSVGPPMDLALGDVNPVWLAYALSSDEFLRRRSNAWSLLTHEFFEAPVHGDLHARNILCAMNVETNSTRAVLVDFETTHVGHILKDLARLEVSLLLEVNAWDQSDARLVVQCLESRYSAEGVEGSALANRLAAGCRKIRELVARMSLPIWPTPEVEYELALLGTVLQVCRYTYPSEAVGNRALALTLAAKLATSVWTGMSDEGARPTGMTTRQPSLLTPSAWHDVGAPPPGSN